MLMMARRYFLALLLFETVHFLWCWLLMQPWEFCMFFFLSLFVPVSLLSVLLLLLSCVYFRFLITEHQPPFLFWSWCYLAGTVMSAHLLSPLSTQHGLQIHSVCVSLYLDYEFLLGWSVAASCTVVYVSVVLKGSYCIECCFWYYPVYFHWIFLPLGDVFSFCALKQKQIKDRSWLMIQESAMIE